MYRISDQQIDYILNDFRARGVEMESLQENLLDHICCIIEQELEANGDFERFYSTTIKTFYKNELKEIEEETISLLNNKNYYTMKKVMLTSGIISAVLLTMGIVLKFLHAPGASFGIVIGITLLSFVFLPLMFTLKIKEKTHSKDKTIFVKDGLKLVRINFDEVLYIKSEGNYANFIQEQSQTMNLISMKELEEKLPAEFVRVHRSFIVNIKKIQIILQDDLVIKDKHIPIGEKYKADLLNRIQEL